LGLEKTAGATPYIRGRRFDYRVQRFFRKLGWFVVRQPHSAFPDLVALRRGAVLLIECRMTGTISRKERRALVTLARDNLGGDALMACRDNANILIRRVSRRSARYDINLPLERFGPEQHHQSKENHRAIQLIDPNSAKQAEGSSLIW
jgi:Holliday junction resolvase